MEKLHSLLRRCREFSEHHTWSPLKEVEQVVGFSRGLFVLGTSPDGEHEVAWGAEGFEDGFALGKHYVRYDVVLEDCVAQDKTIPALASIGLGDVGRLLELDARVLEDSRLPKDEARRWVMDSDRLALGLYLAGGLQGVLLAQLYGPRHEAFFVRSLGVAGEHRRQGWGRRLMRTALRWAVEHGARRLPLNPFNGGTERCP